MPETAFSQMAELLSGAFFLSLEAFQQIAMLPNGLWLALLVVLLAQLSLGVGQSIVLFINQVKPVRFVFSLALNAILFTIGFLFLVFSTWLITLLPWSVNVPFGTLVRVLGLAYAPLLFSFLGALPYLGVPILNLLSVWRLLALVVGFAAVTEITTSLAFGYVAFGWFVLQLLESTIGQPIARFAKKLTARVSGVDFTTDRSELIQRLQMDFSAPASPMVAPSPQSLSEVREFVQTARGSAQTAQAVLESRPQTVGSGELPVAQTIRSANPLMQAQQKAGGIPQPVQLALSLLLMVVLFGVVMVLLRPIRDSFFGWRDSLPSLLQLIFDLVWIGVVALVFAGILAPLETLGWWAGWYDDDLETGSLPESSQIPAASDDPDVARYIVYLDGIGQSGGVYTPDVEAFLNALYPVIPSKMELIQGLMMYSVLNKPLDEDRPLAFLWRMADKMRWKNPAALLGILVNLRNVLIVAVSADQRYGPIYNQGIAQVIYNGLIERGYQVGSGIPITLIGYSGGGEMSVAAGPYLRRATGAPIEVISLGGVMSANNNFLKLEHLYHLVGDKDSVEKLGPIMFPGRWKLFTLSYWNRAKRKGKVTLVPLGPVGHQLPGGMMDPNAFLPDGRSYLQQTVEIILQILQDELLTTEDLLPETPSNYACYRQLDWIHPTAYPIQQAVNPGLYRSIADWVGRLILPKPEERQRVRGVYFEVYHAPDPHQSLIGQTVILRWADLLRVRQLVAAVKRDVHFSADAEYSSQHAGLVHPTRINHWQQVGPLESLAGSLPQDDMVVMLQGQVTVESEAAKTILRTAVLPVQITGRYYGLVQFVQPIAASDRFQVVHFNPDSRAFDGVIEQVRLPEVLVAPTYGSAPSTTHDLEKSPLNEAGWYIYGAVDADGQFVVQSLAPRALFRLQPDQVIWGDKAAYQYIRKQAWADATAQKGSISSVLCTPHSGQEISGQEISGQQAIAEWQEGDRALVLHVYGGIGGAKKEPAAGTPIFFGHFAYGVAEVIREPLTGELRFDIRYHQVYSHNTDGLIAGTLHWSRYLGDRQLGWAGCRPVCDLLVKLDAFTGNYFFGDDLQRSPLDLMLTQLQVMTARYRIGDGTGGTYVGPANNCSQDSNQALFASLRLMEQAVRANADWLQIWAKQNPDQARRFKQLMLLGQELQRELQPLGSPRADWEQNEYNLGCTMEERPLQNLWMGLGSWRTMLPRLASDTVVRIFLKYGASVWVLRTNQIGGYNPDIKPVVPMTL
jgi:predicted Abi (CAAX) family protease